MKAVLIRISTQEIIKKANYPSIEIVPIDSLEEGLEWLIINRLDQPNYDPLTERLERFEEITTDPHPIYTELNQYRIGYNIVTLTEDELDDLEDNEADEKYQAHLEKGLNFHRRSYKKVWKRVLKDRDSNNKLTRSKGRKLFRWFEPVWEDLKNGDFRESEKAITAVLVDNDTELQTEPEMLNTVQWFADLIRSYYDPSLSNGDNDYDL
jgi:hypothetical protein